MSLISKFLDFPELTPFITDLRLQVGSVPWVNINRRWMPHPELRTPLTQNEFETFIRQTQTVNDEMDLMLEGRELDFAFSAEIGGMIHRFRGHESRNYQGMAIDIRVLRANCTSFSDLGFQEVLADEILRTKTGLIMIGGPTGSGKSTTLAAFVNHFGQKNPGSHIVTLEDPVEYLLRLPDCLVSQKHVPVHVKSFEQGIFEAKREKPDLIVIGELRNKEAMRAAVEAAGSGHLVIATTFADRVPRVLDALHDAFAPEEGVSVCNRLSYLLRGVICQALVPSAHVKEGGLAMPVLAYEVLCSDEPLVAGLLQQGAWSDLDLNRLHGCSVSWMSRVEELEKQKAISPATMDFLKKK